MLVVPFLGRPSLVRLMLSGDLDIAAAPRLAAAVQALLGLAREPRAPRRLTYLDLTGVTFLDTHGLRALLQARESIRAAGWRVAIVGATGRVAWLLQVTRTLGLLTRAAAGPRTHAALPQRPTAGSRTGGANGGAQ